MGHSLRKDGRDVGRKIMRIPFLLFSWHSLMLFLHFHKFIESLVHRSLLSIAPFSIYHLVRWLSRQFLVDRSKLLCEQSLLTLHGALGHSHFTPLVLYHH